MRPGAVGRELDVRLLLEHPLGLGLLDLEQHLLDLRHDALFLGLLPELRLVGPQDVALLADRAAPLICAVLRLALLVVNRLLDDARGVGDLPGA